MSKQIAKGTGAGAMEFSQDFVLTKTDSVTPLFSIGLTNGLLKLNSKETALTAHAGGTQAGALALSVSASVHEVDTVGSAADSVKLPLATGSGAVHLVYNGAAANSMQVFGSGTDTINAVATGTGVALAAGKAALFFDYATGLWFSLAGA